MTENGSNQEGSIAGEKERLKPTTVEENVTSYHVFVLGWSSDVKYNRKMIKVMNKAIGDPQDDLTEFVNRTELVFGQIEHSQIQ